MTIIMGNILDLIERATSIEMLLCTKRYDGYFSYMISLNLVLERAKLFGEQQQQQKVKIVSQNNTMEYSWPHFTDEETVRKDS